MSSESIRTAGILLAVFPTVVFGGASLLWHWVTRRTAYYDNPLRQRLWRAGHAHAGVLLLLSLIVLLLVDHAALPPAAQEFVRMSVPAAAILIPFAFFCSVLRPDVQRPNRLINLAYIGAVSVVAGTLTLGVGLLRAV